MSNWLADQLPSCLLDDAFMRGLIEVFAAVAAQTRAHGDALPYLADLDVTPGPMLRYLAQWVAFDALDPELPEGRQRDVVRQLGYIVAWRGTRRGLTALLRVMTDDDVEVETTSPDDDQERPRPARPGEVTVGEAAGQGPKLVTVRVANTAQMTPQRFWQLVAEEIPADCVLRLFVDGRELMPARDRARWAGRDED